MNDILLTLGQNPRARSLVRRLGIPIPLPVELRRQSAPWVERPLADAEVAVGAAPNAAVIVPIAGCLAGAGANVYVARDDLLPAFRDPSEAFGRPARPIAELPENRKFDALVFDATGLDAAPALRAVFDFFQPLVGRLGRSGRVVVLTRGTEGATPDAAAARSALSGFVRSVAKEIGRLGATANLIVVGDGAEESAMPALRFLLSASSAFVTGQPIAVSVRAGPLNGASFVRPLDGKVALVTGAARGIGAAIARAFAAEGARVICVDHPSEVGPASHVAREIGGSTVAVDLASPDAPAKIEGAVRSAGGVDVLVHNAGVTRDKTLARMNAEQWDGVLNVNLTAPIRITEVIASAIRDRGRIVCLSSVSGIAGNVGQAAYAASKAGIIGFVQSAALRLAPRGITVNAVAPGFIETRMTAAMPVAVREVARRLSALAQGGRPEDVAQAIVFLASPGAQGVTGGVLRVCGGSFVGA